jgi:hypothetical protein
MDAQGPLSGRPLRVTSDRGLGELQACNCYAGDG